MPSMPVRIPLVMGGPSRIIRPCERKAEPLAAGRTDARVCVDALAWHFAAQLQRRLCAGVLCRGLFSETAGLVAATADAAGDGRAHEPVLLSRRAGQCLHAG